MANEYNPDDINAKVLNLWKEFSEKQQLPTKLYPLLYDKFKYNQLLFIGLNPSFNADMMKSLGIKSGILADEDDVEAVYRWNNSLTDLLKIGMIINLDSYAVLHHDYYKVLHKIASKIKPQLEMQAIDLLFIRQTKQKEIEKYIKISEDRVKAIDPFFKKQIEFTFELIRHLKPRIIVVVNAFASRIITRYGNLRSLISLYKRGINTLKSHLKRKSPFSSQECYQVNVL